MNLTEDHAKNLPTVRLHKAVLNNFKSVEHGEIVFDCEKHFVPYGTKSDILGIYGQNGSGKTSFIEVLFILKMAMMGTQIPDVYAECISEKADNAKIDFTFDLQYPDKKIRKVVYSFCIKKVKKTEEEIAKYTENDKTDNIFFSYSKYRVKIFNEVLSVSGDFDNKKKRLQTIIDTSDGYPFGPVTKLKALVGNESDKILSLEVNKRLAAERSTSFIFMKDTIETFYNSGLYSDFFQIILELQMFSTLYFYVVDTKSSGFIRLNAVIPIFNRYGLFLLKTNIPDMVSKEMYYKLEEFFSDINIVIQQLIPGLSIELKNISPTILKDGSDGYYIEVVSIRNNIEMPLRYESDGVRKIISVLGLIIAAYNEQSVTVAIDEFDSGIFEYLLGEILQIFEQSGKGQLIFTSHNLRPLEVINKKFLYFTTTNPQNRFIHLKNIGESNNLRSTYYREILLGEQDEEIYNETQNYKIIDALNKVSINQNERNQKKIEKNKNQNTTEEN